MSNVTTMSPPAHEVAFANMTMEDRLMFLYRRELNHSTMLQKAVDALSNRFSTSETIMNGNMNNFFLIVNAIIVFIIQVRQKNKTAMSLLF